MWKVIKYRNGCPAMGQAPRTQQRSKQTWAWRLVASTLEEGTDIGLIATLIISNYDKCSESKGQWGRTECDREKKSIPREF